MCLRKKANLGGSHHFMILHLGGRAPRVNGRRPLGRRTSHPSTRPSRCFWKGLSEEEKKRKKEEKKRKISARPGPILRLSAEQKVRLASCEMSVGVSGMARGQSTESGPRKERERACGRRFGRESRHAYAPRVRNYRCQ